jgi:hypothetical protein
MAQIMFCGAISLVLMLSSVATSQDVRQRVPGFTLVLSRDTSRRLPSNMERLIVKLTNTSDKAMRETICSAFGGLYKLSVVYNGAQLDEPEFYRKRREARERGDCDGSVRQRALKPGESWMDPMEYVTEGPGTYEFTVEEKVFPRDPEGNQIVKSNTLTVVVPEPEAEKQK